MSLEPKLTSETFTFYNKENNPNIKLELTINNGTAFSIDSDFDNSILVEEYNKADFADYISLLKIAYDFGLKKTKLL